MEFRVGLRIIFLIMFDIELLLLPCGTCPPAAGSVLGTRMATLEMKKIDAKWTILLQMSISHLHA